MGSVVDRATGGEKDEAAEIEGLIRTESEKTTNAGDLVDMALYELPIRCLPEQRSGPRPRRVSGEATPHSMD